MKQRCPHSPGGAFSRVKDILTAKVCAEFLGVSVWTIYDRCDAATPDELNIGYGQAAELDAMCADKCGETPLADHAKMSSSRNIRETEDEDLNHKLHLMSAAHGELCRIVSEIDDPAALAETSRLSEKCRIMLLHRIEPIRKVLVQMEKTLAPRKEKAA